MQKYHITLISFLLASCTGVRPPETVLEHYSSGKVKRQITYEGGNATPVEVKFFNEIGELTEERRTHEPTTEGDFLRTFDGGKIKMEVIAKDGIVTHSEYAPDGKVILNRREPLQKVPSIPLYVAKNVFEQMKPKMQEDQEKLEKEKTVFRGPTGANSPPFQIRKVPTEIRLSSFDGGLFIVWLKDAKSGKNSELLVNTTHGGFEKTYIYKPGNYYLDITSNGSWAAVIDNKR